MPCNSDYLEPSKREDELHRAAKLQVWLRKQLNIEIPKWLKDEAEQIYGSDERNVTELCAILKHNNGQIPPSSDREAIDLALWWHDHQKADKKRIAAEQEEIERKAKIKAALSKLNKEDKEVLGLSSKTIFSE